MLLLRCLHIWVLCVDWDIITSGYTGPCVEFVMEECDISADVAFLVDVVCDDIDDRADVSVGSGIDRDDLICSFGVDVVPCSLDCDFYTLSLDVLG